MNTHYINAIGQKEKHTCIMTAIPLGSKRRQGASKVDLSTKHNVLRTLLPQSLKRESRLFLCTLYKMRRRVLFKNKKGSHISLLHRENDTYPSEITMDRVFFI